MSDRVMATTREPLEIEAGRIFRWSFLLIFLIFEWIIWDHLGRGRMRPPGHRLLILLLAPWATRRAAFAALTLAGAATLAGMVFVRAVVGPLLDRWLRPRFDPSSWTFHLAAGEAPLASTPARLRTGGGWRPGALVLTGRRLWFLPSAWGPEPWSLPRGDCGQIAAEPPAFARFLPVRHWPDRLHVDDRHGERTSFAVADPDAVLAWFARPGAGGVAAPRTRSLPEGAFDA